MDNRIALEEMRTMTFTLSLPEGQRGAVLGDLTQTHVIIQDDDGRQHDKGVLRVLSCTPIYIATTF